MIDGTTRTDADWWGTVKGLARAHGWQVALVALLSVAVPWLVEVALAAAFLPYSATVALPVLAGALMGAWAWSWQLGLLTGRRGVLGAHRSPGYALAVLTVWLLVLQLRRVLVVFVPWAPDLFTALVLPPGGIVLGLAVLAATVAACLLPMAVLLEGAGPRRAWDLLRADRPTALRGLAVALLPLLVAALAQQFTVPLLGPMDGRDGSWLTVLLVTDLIGALTAATSTILAYATYLHSPAARPTPTDS